MATLSPVEASSPMDIKQKLAQIWSHGWKTSMQEAEPSFKPQQIDAVTQLHQGGDIMLIAPTAFGKSLIFHSIPLLARAAKSSIDALQQGQKKELDELIGVNAFILNSDSLKESILKDVAKGLYTH